jgi:hypothetical protein
MLWKMLIKLFNEIHKFRVCRFSQQINRSELITFILPAKNHLKKFTLTSLQTSWRYEYVNLIKIYIFYLYNQFNEFSFFLKLMSIVKYGIVIRMTNICVANY